MALTSHLAVSGLERPRCLADKDELRNVKVRKNINYYRFFFPI